MPSDQRRDRASAQQMELQEGRDPPTLPPQPVNIRSHIFNLMLVGSTAMGTGFAPPAHGSHADGAGSAAQTVRATPPLAASETARPERLARNLASPNARTRWTAAQELGERKDSRSVPMLLVALRDADKNVRMYAAYALGEIKERLAAAALLQALTDPEWCVRDQAAWALREIGDPELAARWRDC